MADVYSWTAPPAPVTDLAPMLQPGGSLNPTTTYYYVVIAMASAASMTANTRASAISNEVSATTDSTNKTIRLDWSAISGAAAYCVFRATSSDDFWGTRRVKRPPNDYYYPTTTNNFFVDDGTVGLAGNLIFTVMPASYQCPMGVHPRNTGMGELNFTGGTTTPIDLKDAYDNRVANGYNGIIEHDGLNVATCCYLHLNGGVEVQFKDTKKHWTHIGGITLENSHADSLFQLGEVVNCEPANEVSLACFANNFCPIEFKMPMLICNLELQMGIDSLPGLSNRDLRLSDSELDIHGLRVYDVDTIQFSAKFPMSGVQIPESGVYCPAVFYDNANLWRDNFGDGYWYPTAWLGRLLRWRFLKTAGYVLRINSNRYLNAVDCTYDRCKLEDGTPSIYWGSGATGYVDLWRQLLLRVQDPNGAPVAGQTVSVKDVNGSSAADFDGGTADGLTTDDDGYLWLEKVAVTSATSNTVTDSSKSWAVNEFEGREFILTNGNARWQRMQVKSNNATTLTFTEDFVNTPSADDTGGIVLELKEARCTYKDGSGAGYGAEHTDRTFLSPYAITMSRDDYGDYEAVIALDAAKSLIVTLQETSAGEAPSDVVEEFEKVVLGTSCMRDRRIRAGQALSGTASGLLQWLEKVRLGISRWADHLIKASQ